LPAGQDLGVIAVLLELLEDGGKAFGAHVFEGIGFHGCIGNSLNAKIGVYADDMESRADFPFRASRRMSLAPIAISIRSGVAGASSAAGPPSPRAAVTASIKAWCTEIDRINGGSPTAFDQ
jgi:hypothetical protein